ncbi:ferredoxin reductase [Amycolatopsis sp. DSM 110486]|uniref:ferredoxin reductase n=1 Tax=Amycolatopsis sp. DSM 110486 TaxID=2865832 RepID=UPI001C69BE34|nr:ferredoxin reductase [Amycolatopsis sp. DSM 110486]QYN19363.1 ferredoxin reductase [Amycolatopsis sp. DSM 110486]
MAGTALRRRLNWQQAAVTGLVAETPNTRSIAFALPDWPGHRAGQHVDVRLTAEDGYRAERSYSIASAPEDPDVVLTVERLDDGEVSPYLVDELRVGDEVELRGPVGGHFVWESTCGSPVLLVAGGSGVVPFRSMLRHHAAAGSTVPMRLLYSARSRETLIYADEFTRIGGRGGIDIRVTLTRENSGTRPGEHGRIDRDFLTRAGLPPTEEPVVYVCGPTGFVETVANTLVDLGHRPERIRTERFGGTGTP